MFLDLIAKLVVFLPLVGFLVSGLFLRLSSSSQKLLKSTSCDHKNPESKYSGNKHSRNFCDLFAEIFTTSLLFGALACAVLLFMEVARGQQIQEVILFKWIGSGDFSVNWAIKIDSLTAIMLVVVSSVSSLVHLYAIGYMHEDKSIARFMSYLSLFTFFMLALVTSNNFLQLFFGWEGVGVASYLLIGFWFNKDSANRAAMKAFIANRVGDFGLILAIALIYKHFGTVEFAPIFAAAKAHSQGTLTAFASGFEPFAINLICILLFVGAMGKSAQIGLHVWLADAMEGPTPVSALIHAATMVTAGVFMVARCSPLFELADVARDLVAIIGAITALFAATIAITQNDIKRIIAYSTCSQLGYMFFACGVSAYSPAIFHLATHAFFKALLFLSAGSVIHAMHHEQNIQKMGGLWRKIPFTYAMMWIGSLALAGFPPFAGFYSKDAILEAAYASNGSIGKIAYGVGIAAALLTAFYSWRLLFLVFHGKNRSEPKDFGHAHESPLIMLVPLAFLAVGSVAAGYVGQNLLLMISFENNFFADAIFIAESRAELLKEMHHVPILVKILPILVGIAAIAFAYISYLRNGNLPNRLVLAVPRLYRGSFGKWFFDEIYEAGLVSPIKKLGEILWKLVDIKMIDSVPNQLAASCKFLSARVSKLHTGLISGYSTWMIFGLITIGAFFVNDFVASVADNCGFFVIIADYFKSLIR